PSKPPSWTSMSSPKQKAASIFTRCGSFMHQKAMTRSNKSGAGCHTRHGNREISHTSSSVIQINSGLEGRLNGELSMGCSELSDDRRCPAIGVLLAGMRTIQETLLVRFRRRDIDTQNQKMTMPFGMRQRFGNCQGKPRCHVAFDSIDFGDRQAGWKQAADAAGDQCIAGFKVNVGGEVAHFDLSRNITTKGNES